MSLERWLKGATRAGSATMHGRPRDVLAMLTIGEAYVEALELHESAPRDARITLDRAEAYFTELYENQIWCRGTNHLLSPSALGNRLRRRPQPQGVHPTMTDQAQPPESTGPTFGQAFTALTVSTMVGHAQAAQFKALVDNSDISPEQAVEIVARTQGAVLENAAGIIRAITGLGNSIAEIVAQVSKLSETDFIKFVIEETKTR